MQTNPPRLDPPVLRLFYVCFATVLSITIAVDKQEGLYDGTIVQMLRGIGVMVVLTPWIVAISHQ